MRGRVYPWRSQPLRRQRGHQLLALAGTLLVHVLFLFGFVLGAAFQSALPPPPGSEQMLQVRLIEPPEPPPPPAVRGTPPKERGPRHQGQRRLPGAQREPSANTVANTANAPPVPTSPVVAAVRQAPAPGPKPVVATPLAATLPAPAPLPLPKPLKPAGEPPALAVPIPIPLPPAAPPFQPEPVRPPQVEGNRPILPPASLALPKAAVPAPANLPVMAIHMDVPQTIAPVSVTPAPQPAASPDLPRLQPLPLPAQRAPIVALQTPPVLAAVFVAPKALAEPAAASSVSSESPVALATAAASRPPIPIPLSKLDVNPPTRTPATPAPALHPAPSTSIVVADVTPLTPAPSPVSESVSPATSASVESATSVRQVPAPGAAIDVSRAPDATAQGSDTATLGAPTGAARAPSAPLSADTGAPHPLVGAGTPADQPGKSLAAGRPGGNQPGAPQGAPHGAVGDYVQLKPTGDTEIMRRGAPDIGYQPTRFDKDWTPEDESSVDTALRRAVEKTTVKHTFHLPRGVRVECAVKPLLPIALFGCRNPDPPAAPVAEKVYDPMHLGPAQPLAPSGEASGTPAPPASAPTPMIKFDNRAECAAARVAGGPAPPDCPVDLQTGQPIHLPASSSSSWVPASDQFH